MDTNDKKYIVYMHISPNHKRYIGITSLSPQKRWKSDGAGYKEQLLFWRAICKYGWDNFQHKILLQDKTLEDACQIEACLIEHYKTYDSKYGYNLTLGGEGRVLTEQQKRALSEQRQGKNACSYGYYPSNDTKKKMSDAAKNKTFTTITRAKMSKAKKKLVYQYDLNGNLLNTFNSATDGANATGTNRGNLCACCRNVVKQANGFFWSYKLINDPDLIKSYLAGDISFSIIKTRNEKKIIQMDLENNELNTFDSIRAASSATGIPSQEISQACKNPKKVTREFKWKFLNDDKNIDFEIIEEKSNPCLYGQKKPLVFYNGSRNTWIAYFMQDGKKKTIKTCKTKEDAINAYCEYFLKKQKENGYGSEADLLNLG